MKALILYLLLAVGWTFVSSILESVILSVTPAYVGLQVKNGTRSGALLKRLKDRIDRSLAAILTLNTIAQMVGAAGVGAQVLHLYGDKGLALGSALLTVLMLVVAEIVPKTLGAVYWKRLAPPVAYAVRVLIVITYPLVVFLERLSHLLAAGSEHGGVTREEMVVLAELGESEGQLHHHETRIISNLLRLHDIRVGDILTPRAVVEGLRKNLTVDEAIRSPAPRRFSRIPVYTDDLDDISGYVIRGELFDAFTKGEGDKPLEALSHPVHVVPESRSVRAVLQDFIERKEHLFLVVDEYGGTAGLVTLEDSIETLLGLEIVDELDNVEDLRKWARELWEKRMAAEEREL
jgi:CBS domain containing-hemolysin-like protein